MFFVFNIIIVTNYRINRFNKYIQIIPSCTITFFIKKVANFGPFFGPSSALFIRTHERNLRNYL